MGAERIRYSKKRRVFGIRAHTVGEHAGATSNVAYSVLERILQESTPAQLQLILDLARARLGR